jgi:hypothetical protein
MTLTHPDVYRQSLLRAFTVCARRTMHGMKVDGELALGWVEHYGDLGKALHEVAAEILRTLYRQGEQQMPTQEAIEVMYEVLPAAVHAAVRGARRVALAGARVLRDQVEPEAHPRAGGGVAGRTSCARTA